MGISIAEQEEIRELARNYFATTPQSVKDALSVSKDSSGYRGYQNLGVNITQNKPDMHEGFDFIRTLARSEFQWGTNNNNENTANDYEWIHIENKWPTSEIKEKYNAYIAKMLILGRSVMRAIAASLNKPPDYFDEYYSSSFWILRAISYPMKKNESNGSFGCGTHTDYGCLTFVNMDEIDGCLQVQNRVTGNYVNAMVQPGEFVCNIGDMLEYWTGQQFVSTPHRVLNPTDQSLNVRDNMRISVPFFFEPNFNAKIACMVTTADADGDNDMSTDDDRSSHGNFVIYGEHLTNKLSSNFA